MKKFVKGRWFPPIAVAIATVIVALVMALFGWKLTYAPELENSWNAISAVATCAGAIGTVVVLWYNHKAIELTQVSVQQAINLQLYEKRLELYSALSKDTAFEQVPMSLKIVYSEEIYDLCIEISELCYKRSRFIHALYELRRNAALREAPCWNVCESKFQQYLENIEYLIGMTEMGVSRKKTLIQQKAAAEELHQRICHQYIELESKMKKVLEESINIET